MSIQQKSDFENALANIPEPFKSKIIFSYLEIKKAYIKEDFISSMVNSGRFCEIVIRFLQYHFNNGNYINFNNPLHRFNDLCKSIENYSAPRTEEGLKILIPRMLNFIYSIRNKRNAGHVTGAIDTNKVDALVCLKNVDWCICELIRIFNNLKIEDAQNILDNISIKNIPIIWKIDDKTRVLKTDLKFKDKTLLILYYNTAKSLNFDSLFSSVEYSRKTDYKSKVIRSLHKEKMIEFNEGSNMITISPKGVDEVERKLILESAQ